MTTSSERSRWIAAALESAPPITPERRATLARLLAREAEADEEEHRYRVQHHPDVNVWAVHRATYRRRKGTSTWVPASSEVLGTRRTKEAAQALREEYPPSPFDGLDP